MAIDTDDPDDTQLEGENEHYEDYETDKVDALTGGMEGDEDEEEPQ